MEQGFSARPGEQETSRRARNWPVCASPGPRARGQSALETLPTPAALRVRCAGLAHSDSKPGASTLEVDQGNLSPILGSSL
eukprot:15438689-Alexandrium_andersonii.AAC.1